MRVCIGVKHITIDVVKVTFAIKKAMKMAIDREFGFFLSEIPSTIALPPPSISVNISLFRYCCGSSKYRHTLGSILSC